MSFILRIKLVFSVTESSVNEEVSLIQKINHKNVVSFFDVFPEVVDDEFK